jgi:predicted Zn-ribbon and HTH transcriptional regulator
MKSFGAEKREKKLVQFNFCPSCCWTATTYTKNSDRCPRCNHAIYKQKIVIEIQEINVL